MFSFARNKKSVDVLPYIRRICDLTTPNLATISKGRSENRLNRAIPTLMCAVHKDGWVEEETAFCLTKDFADHGVCIVLPQPFRAERVVLGYWVCRETMPSPWFFSGLIRRNQPIGGGFWSVGIEMNAYINEEYPEIVKALRDKAAKLLPAAPANA